MQEVKKIYAESTVRSQKMPPKHKSNPIIFEYVSFESEKIAEHAVHAHRLENSPRKKLDKGLRSLTFSPLKLSDMEEIYLAVASYRDTYLEDITPEK